MAVVRIRVKTNRRFGNIDSIIKTVQSNSAAAAYNYARRTSTDAKGRVHVITGHLRDSIHTEKRAVGRHAVVVGAHYGAYEEYGTRHRPPHPFLRPAVEAQKAQFLADLRNVFKVNHR